MRLRIAEGQESGRILTLKPEGFGIGRGHDSDLMISEEGVSRHHCRVCQAGGAWLVEDLNSTNGVSVNGRRVEGTRLLAVGDRIAIGKHVLVLEEGDASVTSEVLAAPALAAVLAAPAITQVEPEPAVTPAGRAEPLWDEADLPLRRRFPWVRLALLVVLLGVIGTLAFLVFSRGGSPAAPATTGTADAGAEPASAPTEVSDAELAKLIADEEKAPSPRADQGPTLTSAAAQPAAVATDDAPAAGGGEPAPAEAGRAVVSDLVFVASDPPGALVSVDAKEQGVTPLLVRGLEKGRHRIVLSLDGYEEFDRQIHVPDLLPARPYALRAKAGTVGVVSSAPGTAVWRGPQFLGVAPTLIQGLPPGEYDLAFAAPGCEPLRKAVTVSEVSSTRVEVDPKPLLGALEIATQPAGCAVSIEGALKGVTQPAGDLGTASALLRFAGLRAGTYTVLVEHPAGVSRSGKLAVKPGETVSQAVRLWIPDTRVVFSDGTMKTGMIVERNEQGDIVLAETARQLERYLKPQVANVVALSKEETAEILKKQGAIVAPRGPDGKSDEKEKAEGKDKPRDAGDRRGADAKAEGEGTIAWGDEPALPARTDRPAAAADTTDFTIDDLAKLLREQSSTELTHRFKDRRVTVRGKASGIGKDSTDSYISFGRRVRCYVDREAYGDGEKESLRTAVAAAETLSVTGGSAGFRGDVLILKDCKAKVVAADEKK
jgi:hypothetical protein